VNAESLSEQIGVVVENLLAPLSTTHAFTVEIRQADQVLYSGVFGADTANNPVRTDTLFDLDSLTELFTLTAFLRLVDTGRLWLDTPVNVVLEEFDKEATFYQLLSHTAGMPDEIDLNAYSDYDARLAALLDLAPYKSRDRSPRYSPVDFILIGFSLEVLLDLPLAQAIAVMVLQPLDLRAQFAPLSDHISVVGSIDRDVRDLNARALDSIAGHAGLFGTASDVSAVARLFLQGGTLGDADLFSEVIASEATRQHIAAMGLGWNSASSNPADGFGYEAANGSFVRVDELRQLVITLIADSGDDSYDATEKILHPLQTALISAVQHLVDSADE
jgi:CubicO group peptidase (beta-lactamase class C family)